jgi:hypothetical protein
MGKNAFQVALYCFITHQYPTYLKVNDNITIEYEPHVKQFPFLEKDLIIEHMNNINNTKQEKIENSPLWLFDLDKYLIVDKVDLFPYWF